MPDKNYEQMMTDLRRPNSLPDDATKPTPYTHSVANERLSNIAMAGSQGPFATIAFEDSGKTSNIFPGSELAGGFVVEEITPEGVVVLPETGPRQIWQRGQSQRQVQTTPVPVAMMGDFPAPSTEQEQGTSIPGVPGMSESEMEKLRQAVASVATLRPPGHQLIPQDYAGYGAEHIYKNDAPGAANDMAQADLNLRINKPGEQNTISSSDEPNWNSTGWTLHTIKGEDMTRFFLEMDDQVLNMTGHPDFPQPDEE